MGYWNRKTELKKKANTHTNKMEELYSLEITECVNNTKVYDQGFYCKKECDSKPDFHQKITVEDMDSVQAIFSYGPYLLGKLTNRCSAVGISPQPVGN